METLLWVLAFYVITRPAGPPAIDTTIPVKEPNGQVAPF